MVVGLLKPSGIRRTERKCKKKLGFNKRTEGRSEIAEKLKLRTKQLKSRA